MLRISVFWGWETVGKHMAANLLKGNYSLSVYDSDPQSSAELVNLGASAARTPKDVAAGKDLVIVIRPEKCACAPTSTAKTGFRRNRSGHDPRRHGDAFSGKHHGNGRGSGKAPAHVSRRADLGTKEHAANGLLTILVGGEPSVISRCRKPSPFLASTSSPSGRLVTARHEFVGQSGQAELMQALAEVWFFGEKLGLAPTKSLRFSNPAASARPSSIPKGKLLPAATSLRQPGTQVTSTRTRTRPRGGQSRRLKLPRVECACKTLRYRPTKDGRGGRGLFAVIKSCASNCHKTGHKKAALHYGAAFLWTPNVFYLIVF